MINHARTLLLNQKRSRVHNDDPGYEYVPPNFTPVVLPTTLTLVRQILFGSFPDNYFLNFRCRELLAYIHETELAEYIYKLDPRVTYWPELSKPFFNPARKIITVTQTSGLPRRISINGNLNAIQSIGRAQNQYRVNLYKIAQNNTLSYQVEVLRVGDKLHETPTTIDNPDLPALLNIRDTALKFQITASAVISPYSDVAVMRNDFLFVENYAPTKQLTYETEPIESGLAATWNVTTTAKPEPVLTTAISAFELLGEPAFLELFGVKNVEPYLTFKNLWADHPLPTYRLSGIVLALIYRTEELRS